MKKLLSAIAIAATLVACNNSSESADTAADSTNKMSTDTMSTPPVMDTSSKMSGSMYTPSEGTMTMKDGKMMEMKNGNWVAMDKTITCTDGCKVMTTGEVVMKDGKKMMLKEGEMVDKDGNMMDKDGKMLDMKGKM